MKPYEAVNPARRDRKAFADSVGGCSGRQWKKRKKANRHIAKFLASKQAGLIQ